MPKYAACASFVRASVAAVIGSAMLLTWSVSVLSAEDKRDDKKNDEELTEVQVTGTRIQQRPNYISPNPVTTVTGDDLRKLGMVNVSDAITTLVPQNISQYQAGMTGNLTGMQSSFFIGQTIANLRGLDPPFGSRTLTMIDGRRVVSTSNQADVVDLNIIPSNLLSRMDVVTGGASATYGSGAMAGVVNLVLNNRLQGMNLDMDYGENEAGDGGTKHIALSGGTKLFGGRGHILVGGEWQDQNAIRDCAAARDWCGESRGLLVNSANSFLAPGAAFTPLAGYEGLPFRFEVTNLRYSQFTPDGAIITQNVNNLSGYRFTPDGTGVEEYALGYRGGSGAGAQVVNGDGPAVTSGTTLMPASNRKTAFSHFEFDFTERVTGYAEASYAKTSGVNIQFPTQLGACVRFDQPGVAAKAGAQLQVGDTIPLWAGFGSAAPPADSPFSNLDFINFIGGYANWFTAPSNGSWGPNGFTLTAPFSAPDVPAVLPADGRGNNAYLAQLSPEALAQVRNSFGNAPTTGNGASTLIYGSNACDGQVGVYKVWNPQIQQRTEQDADTLRGVLGVKGRFGESWRWDGYYQYGRTKSESEQYNAMTNYRYAFAMDSVIDDRQDSPTFGQPVCRVTRDGLPTTTATGEPFSDYAGLMTLAQGCQPIDPFGSAYTGAQAQAQAAGLAYAFRPLLSSGENRLDVLSLTTSGTLLKGWAGPLTAAFTAEYRKDQVNNEGSEGAAIERLDFPFPWADKFGGRTNVYEESAEFDVPLLSGLDGIQLLSVDGAIRHGTYKNKGGAGTTGESGTQNVTNWKFSAEYEPFDWIRFRFTRSRDLRTAGYRELYYNSPGAPDSTSAANYWRPYDPLGTASRTDQLTTNSIGDPELKPERSYTTTVGFVLSPSGWAQGMRLSVDYSDIKVKDGLTQSFSSPIQACWSASGNSDPVIQNGVVTDPGSNGAFDANNPYCQMLHFGTPSDPTNPYSNLVSYDTSFENGEPFQIRALDMSLDYLFPLNRLFESAPGTFSLTVRANRALEASGLLSEFLASALGIPRTTVDFVGQLGSGLGWVPGIQPTPKWSGNIITSYLYGPMAVSLSARYVGGAAIDKTYYSDAVGQPYYVDANGNFVVGSIDNNHVPAYLNFSLNGSYDIKVSGTKQFQVFATVNNLFDKDPPYAGGYLSGASPQFHDIYGRAYRAGVRVRF